LGWNHFSGNQDHPKSHTEIIRPDSKKIAENKMKTPKEKQEGY
jgi:hypothetical protein